MVKMGRCIDLVCRDAERNWMYSRSNKVVAAKGEKARSFGKDTVISVSDWMLQEGDKLV